MLEQVWTMFAAAIAATDDRREAPAVADRADKLTAEFVKRFPREMRDDGLDPDFAKKIGVSKV